MWRFFVLFALVGTTLTGCSKSCSVGSLEREFPKYREDLNTIRNIFFVLNESTTIKGIAEIRDVGYILISENEPWIQFDEAVNQRFSQHEDRLLQLKKLVEKLKVDAVHFNIDGYLRVTICGGGVLGVDTGYFYPGEKPVETYKFTKIRKIPDEKWYVYLD